MFFIFSKILSFFIYPFSWVLLFFFITLFTKREKLKKWSKIATVFLLLFFSNTVIFLECVRMWEPRGKTIASLGQYDVGVVLGGMAEYDNNHKRLSLRRGGDRIWQAIHLYTLGKIDKIMIVGANGDLNDKGLNEAVQFKAVLIDMGIPPADIIIEENSKNTHQNAVEAKKVLENDTHAKKVLLITSALHMKRAEACFKKAGFIEFDTFSTDHFTGKVRGYQLDQYIIPNGSNLTDWGRFIHEVIGFLTYKMMGYV